MHIVSAHKCAFTIPNCFFLHLIFSFIYYSVLCIKRVYFLLLLVVHSEIWNTAFCNFLNLTVKANVYHMRRARLYKKDDNCCYYNWECILSPAVAQLVRGIWMWARVLGLNSKFKEKKNSTIGIRDVLPNLPTGPTQTRSVI